MMEASQDIVSCYPVTFRLCMSLGLAWWRNSHLVGWRSDWKGHWSKEATKEFNILFIAESLVSFTKPHELSWRAMKKKAFWVIPLLYQISLSPNISLLEDETKSSFFLICNENQILVLNHIVPWAGFQLQSWGLCTLAGIEENLWANLKPRYQV